MTTKAFDCVEMKRRGAEYIYNIVKDMTLDQEVEYWRRRSEDYRREWLERRAKASEPANHSRT